MGSSYAPAPAVMVSQGFKRVPYFETYSHGVTTRVERSTNHSRNKRNASSVNRPL